jgi:hypothetical protein
MGVEFGLRAAKFHRSEDYLKGLEMPNTITPSPPENMQKNHLLSDFWLLFLFKKNYLNVVVVGPVETVDN